MLRFQYIIFVPHQQYTDSSFLGVQKNHKCDKDEISRGGISIFIPQYISARGPEMLRDNVPVN